MGLIECKHVSTLITNEGNFVCKECGEITTPLTKAEKRILELEKDLAKSKKRTKELGDSLNRMYSDACQKVGKLESAIKEIYRETGGALEDADPLSIIIKQLCEKCDDGLGEKK